MSSTKRITSEPPDVTVVVGSGGKERLFECHGAILAAASPVLEAMLSSDMKEGNERRILFPDKSPDAWQLFLECIDPSSAFLARNSDYETPAVFCTCRNKSLSEANARSLIPVFHELQMDVYVQKCDEVLRDTVVDRCDTDSAFPAFLKSKRQYIDQLAFACRYDLKKTQKKIETVIGRILEAFCWGIGDDDAFDVATVEELVDICRPVQLREKEQPAKKQRCDATVKGLYESCKCKSIWNQLSSCVDEDLTLLPPEDMNHGKALSRVIYYSLHRYHKSMGVKLEQITNKLTEQERSGCEVSLLTLEKSRALIRELWRLVGLEDTIPRRVHRIAMSIVPYNTEPGNFSRNFNLQQGSTPYRLYMDFKPDLLKENRFSKSFNHFVELQSAMNDFSLPNESTISRFGSPNITVVVGSGEELKEFECNRTLLLTASTKLEGMIIAGSEKLILPNESPDAWEHFYKCINPRFNGCTLTKDNAKILAPLFQTFEMTNYLDEAKEFLVQIVSDFDEYNESLSEIINLLKYAISNGFSDIEDVAEGCIRSVVSDLNNSEIHPDLDIQSVRDLMSLCLPLHKEIDENAGQVECFVSSSRPTVWRDLRRKISRELSTLSVDKVDTSDCELFANFVYQSLRAVAALERPRWY